jgi:glutathione S-transferase
MASADVSLDLYPKDPEDIYRVEAAIAYMIDIRQKVFEWIMIFDPVAKEAARKKYYEEVLPGMLKKLEAFYLQSSAKAPYFQGSSITIADVYAVCQYAYNFCSSHKEYATKAYECGIDVTM